MSFGNLKIGAVTLSLNWQFLAVGVFVVGLQAFFLGCIAQVLFDYTGETDRTVAARLSVHPDGVVRRSTRLSWGSAWRSRWPWHTSTTTWR